MQNNKKKCNFFNFDFKSAPGANHAGYGTAEVLQGTKDYEGEGQEKQESGREIKKKQASSQMKQQAVSQTKWIEHLIWALLVKTCSVTKMLSNCICNGFFFPFSNFLFSLDGFFLSSAFAFGARRERRSFRWINLD